MAQTEFRPLSVIHSIRSLSLIAGLIAAAGCDGGNGTATPTTPPTTPPTRPMTAGPNTVQHDYGILPLGTSLTHDFDIPIPRNPYGPVIVADSFQGDCSCAIGVVMIRSKDGDTRPVYGLPPDLREIKPGDSCILRLTLDTKDKEAADVPRTFSRGSVDFDLPSGDYGRRERVAVHFHYGIRTPIKVSPVAHIDFGQLPICQKSYHRVLELTSNIPERPLTLGSVHAEPRSIAARLEKDGDRTLLHITITPTLEPSERAVRGVVAISTGIDTYTDLKIPVTGTFIGTIQYVPAEVISFDMFDFTRRREGFVNLTDHDKSRPHGFEVLNFRNGNGNDISEHFEVKFKDLANDGVRVTVAYLGTMTGKTMRGWLSLAKPGADEQVARVRIVGHNTPKK